MLTNSGTWVEHVDIVTELHLKNRTLDLCLGQSKENLIDECTNDHKTIANDYHDRKLGVSSCSLLVLERGSLNCHSYPQKSSRVSNITYIFVIERKYPTCVTIGDNLYNECIILISKMKAITREVHRFSWC